MNNPYPDNRRNKNNAPMIGIYGGTFDPIHWGHINAINSLLDEVPFSEIHLLPSANPPHRAPTKASDAHRLAMLQLALADNCRANKSQESRAVENKLRSNDFEIMQGGLSYTVDTIAYFKRRFPEAKLYLIMGQDAFDGINTWHRYEEILKAIDIMVMRRDSHGENNTDNQLHKSVDDALEAALLTSVHFVKTRLIDISSTLIRQRLAQNINVNELVPDSVIGYIQQHNLYQ